MIKDALSMLRPALKAQNLKAHNLEAQNMRVQDRAPEDMVPETIAPKNRALENQRPVAASAIGFGLATIDAVLGGGLTRGGVHEIYAPSSAHTGAATGFATALAVRAAGARPILWVRQDFLDAETGCLNAAGLAEFGLDPARIILVRARDAEGVLRAGEQAARCASLGVVVIEPCGSPKILDFTASRRLSLASAKSGVPILLHRATASPSHSAALTRWSVAAARSRALEANAPGFPAFELNLLRHRGGTAGQSWCVEWDRDRKSFQSQQRAGVAPLPCTVVSLSGDRSVAAGAARQEFQKLQEFRRAG